MKATALTEAVKLRILIQIEGALRDKAHVSLRACGLAEFDATALVEALPREPLVEVFRVEDEGSILDAYHVEEILPHGWAILRRPRTLTRRAWGYLLMVVVPAVITWLLRTIIAG
jgi:hypothetical protein